MATGGFCAGCIFNLPADVLRRQTLRPEQKTEKQLKGGFQTVTVRPRRVKIHHCRGGNTHHRQAAPQERVHTFHCGLSKRQCPLLARGDRTLFFFYCPEVRAATTSRIILGVKGSTYASHLLYRPSCCIQPCFSKGAFNADLIIRPKSPSNSTTFVFIFCIIQVYNRVYNTLRAQITPARVCVCSASKVMNKQMPSCKN